MTYSREYFSRNTAEMSLSRRSSHMSLAAEWAPGGQEVTTVPLSASRSPCKELG